MKLALSRVRFRSLCKYVGLLLYYPRVSITHNSDIFKSVFLLEPVDWSILDYLQCCTYVRLGAARASCAPEMVEWPKYSNCF